MNKLKLYYWPSVETLADYTDGACFALAASRKEAIEAICKGYDGPSRRREILREELLNTQPEVISSTKGFVLYGGG